MDSVTQAALGAAVGVAVMGRSRPVWQGALFGALVATLPDLDVFIDKGGPVRNMVLHRAETHAIFWQALASPVIAALLTLVTRTRPLFRRWWAMALLVLFTHSLLDSLTIYGTRIGLPFIDTPVGLGSLFIIDPLYTLPLLVGVFAALLIRSTHRFRWNTGGLMLSTLYAGWAIAAQAYVTEVVMDTPEAQTLPAERVLVTPAPFNTLLWRIVLIDGARYHEGFYSVFDPFFGEDDKVRFESHPRGASHEPGTASLPAANLIRAFSKGFYALSDDGRYVTITDLRMGQFPYYAFNFAIAEHRSEPLHAIDPIRTTRRLPLGPGLRWLSRRILGEQISAPRNRGE